MKRIKIIWFVVLLFIAMPLKAQTYEEWSGTIESNKLYNAQGTVIVTLKGDVQIKGTITVDNWTTLRIINPKTNGKVFTISNGLEGMRETPMFKVIGGAKLAFNYRDDQDDKEQLADKYNRIVIDGGANFGDMDFSDPDKTGKWFLTAQSNKRFSVPMIQTIGALELFLVDIQNFYGPDDFDEGNYDVIGAIGIASRHLTKADGTAFITGENVNYRYTEIQDCVIQKCKSRTGPAINLDRPSFLNKELDPMDPDRLISLKNVTIQYCVAFGDKSGWGGMIRCKGASVHSMKLINTTFQHNFSHADGAGLWWNAGGHSNTKCIIDGCTFTHNRAMRNSGALRLETTFEFSKTLTGKNTVVSNNECFGKTRTSPDTYEYDEVNNKGNGGGIHIYGYAGGYVIGGEGYSFNYSLPACLEVSNNYAYGYGGGIAFDFTQQCKLEVGTTINSYFNGVTISENKSRLGGGGIYFSNTTTSEAYKFNVLLNSGSISGNSARDGGGLYVTGLPIGSSDSGTITISDNNATNGSGGGIYLKDGNITLNTVNIQNNASSVINVTSFQGGGGVYVENGSFEIVSGEISKNTSAAFGGGVLVQSNTTDEGNEQTVTLSGGDIKANEARYGGGLAALGNLKLTVADVDIENNIATDGNGGGVFVQGKDQHATLTYTAGLIRQNKVILDENYIPETAYGNTDGTQYAKVSGMGGGICMGKNTTLEFSNVQKFGIYDNEAESGADDLFVAENNTKIVLPNVKNMKLEGYDENQSHKLFWFEDYITHDPNYCFGTATNKEWTEGYSQNQRYRDVRDHKVDGMAYYLDFGDNEDAKTFESKYLCLTLGWNVGLITLIKNGMADGENAIFQILKKKDDSYNNYMTVILTDADKKDGKRSKQITLDEDGTWRIVETPWSWAYTTTDTDKDNPNDGIIERTLDASSSVSDRTFEFTNTLNTNNPVHGESVKVNKMGKNVQQE